MATENTKICPDCGAVNDSNDLFCQECGSSLAMVGNATQQTAAFTPITNGAETQTTSIAPAVAPQPSVTPSYTAIEPQPTYGYVPQEESSRGAVLGWLAATLMLIIIAAFVWAYVISDSTRDSITGIF